ncbi:MAG: hypothetical protein ACRC15_00840, partial [Cetobacterium sp.]
KPQPLTIQETNITTVISYNSTDGGQTPPAHGRPHPTTTSKSLKAEKTNRVKHQRQKLRKIN